FNYGGLMDAVRRFTTSQAARLAGLKYATVDYWDRTGFLSPSVAPATGKGSDRLYAFQDLVALRVARELRAAGVSLQCLREVVQFLRDQRGVECPLAESYLVTDGKDVYVRDGDAVL